MKKIILAFILSLLLFCSCKNEYNILSYQENDIEAECVVNEKFNLEIKKTGKSVSISVLSPKSLAGVKFEIGENSSFVIKDEIKIPLKNEDISGIYALSRIFSLNEEAITTASYEGVISFDTEYGIYSVSYGKNNLPKSITVYGNGFSYSVVIKGIKLSPSSTAKSS